MTSTIRCPRFEDYTIGWISALPMELAAGIRMLDETYHPPLQDVTDMGYVFGSIGSVNIIMACLPVGQYGTTSAAGVAVDMRSRFRNLRFCLLVGIGGGVPSSDNDIRLGDIVVSQPNGTNGGVVQYDFGKNTLGGLERTGWLNAPPNMLLKLLSAYQAKNIDLTQTGKSSSHPFRPRSTKHLIPDIPDTDNLFLSDYEHIDGPDCSNCNPRQVVSRNARGPMIHYGTIASGNQVIKNAKMRDKLSKELGNVLCFDMEAAGIMNALPCLVIRGISDYADSHKNKIWQSYAAVVAAAVAKELFPGVPETRVKKHDSITTLSTTSWLTRMQKTAPMTLAPDAWSTSTQQLVGHEYFARCHLSDYDYTAVHSAYTRSRCPNTTLWIFDDTRYTTWYAAAPSSCLWLTGKIGSGKTMITSTVIEHILREHQEHNHPPAILHYFCRHTFKEGLTATTIVASLIQQVLDSLENRDIAISSQTMKIVDLVFGRKSVRLEYETIVEKIFLPLLAQLGKIIVLVDGLDECDAEDVFKILELIRRLLEQNNAKFFLSSRESLDISKSIPSSMTIFVSNSDSKKDICTYIDWRLKAKLQQTSITEDEKLLHDIRTSLAEKADGMILWVYLQIENIWEDCSTDVEIREALSNLPKDLNETYAQCMNKIGSNRGAYARKYAAKLLPWMLAAHKPFTMIELREALAINEEDGTFDRNRMPSSQILLRSCANLITLSAASFDSGDDGTCQIFLVHHTLRQFLESASETYPFLQDKKVITLSSLCIRHLLSNDYNLSLQQTGSAANLHLEPPMLRRITSNIPEFVRPFLPKVKPVALTINLTQPSRPKPSGLPSIFHYARDQWPHLTRSIRPDHELFSEFQNIALQPNLTYRLHPWQLLGQSLESHCLGLLAWSIVHAHEALFNLVIRPDAPILIRRETLEAPIPQFGALNVVLLAVRHDAEWALTRMAKFNSESVQKLLLSEDANGWNSLHHAADAGCHRVIDVLGRKFHVPYKVAISDGGIHSPLSIAVFKKDVAAASITIQIARLMPKKHRFETDESYILARNKAIEYGSIKLMRVLDVVLPSEQRYLRKIIDRSKQAFSHALRADHTPISIYLMRKGFYNREWFFYEEEWRLLVIPILLKTHDLTLMKTVWENVNISAGSSRMILHSFLLFAADVADDASLKLLATFFTHGFEDLLKTAIRLPDEDLTKKLCQLVVRAGNLSILDTAVLVAAVEPSATVFGICLEFCNNVDVTDNFGFTPLMCAAKRGHFYHIQLLMEASNYGKRVNVNGRNAFGESAVELCCKAGAALDTGSISPDFSSYVECAILLIQHGATSSVLLDNDNKIVRQLLDQGILN